MNYLPEQSLQIKTPLINAVGAYQKTNRLRFHVPGHAGKLLTGDYLAQLLGFSEAFFQNDLTELEGLDVLSEPESCLLKSQQMAAEVFGVAHSFYLVNGASVGLTAAMLSVLAPGDKILLPRNVHRSIMSGLILTGAEPIWCLPEYNENTGLWGTLNPQTVKCYFEQYPDIKALLLTSPTYEGVGSDIASLLKICREFNAYLIVDEAHGSLWPFNDNLPVSAAHLPCDAVIHSLHKSAGSLTQTAITHLPHGSKIKPEHYQEALNTLQTTSPSYPLLISIEAAVALLSSYKGKQRVQQNLENIQWLRQAFNQKCENFSIITPENALFYDSSKLWIQHKTWQGIDWAPIIEAGIESENFNVRTVAYESATPKGTLYVGSLGLEKTDYEAFLELFLYWDKQENLDLNQKPTIDHLSAQQSMNFHLPETVISPREAFFAPGETIVASESLGRISKQTIVHCPPGIPILFPGEIITEAILPLLPLQVQVCQGLYPEKAADEASLPRHLQTL